MITFETENVSAPDEIIFELISETAFLNKGWRKLIQKLWEIIDFWYFVTVSGVLSASMTFLDPLGSFLH